MSHSSSHHPVLRSGCDPLLLRVLLPDLCPRCSYCTSTNHKRSQVSRLRSTGDIPRYLKAVEFEFKARLSLVYMPMRDLLLL